MRSVGQDEAAGMGIAVWAIGSMPRQRNMKRLMSGLAGCQCRQGQKEPQCSKHGWQEEGRDERACVRQRCCRCRVTAAARRRRGGALVAVRAKQPKPSLPHPDPLISKSLTHLRIDAGRLWQPNLQQSGIITQERRKLDLDRDWPGADVRFANQVRRSSCSCA